MKNKILVLSILMLILLSSICFASQEVIEVRLNDKYIDFTDDQGNRVDPALINDRTMVPMRKIFESFGANVEWDGATQRVIATTEGKEITLQIDNNEAKLKDVETEEEKNIKLDSAPVILNDRTMVPVRFIAESLDKQVGWDAENRVVVIIDYDDVIEDIQKECSTFIEMMNEQTVEVNTFDSTTNIKGSLSYKDGANSKNNESLTISGSMNAKKSDDKAEIEFNLKFTGKGQLKDALKENEYDNIKIGVIEDIESGDVYSYSSLENDGKWIKSEALSISEVLSTMNTSLDFKSLIYVSETDLNKDSYDGILKVAEEIKSLFGNDRITVSGKTTKTYTMKWGLDEVLSKLNVVDEEQLNELLSLGKATVQLTVTYKNGMNTKSKIDIDLSLQMKDTKEKLTGTITCESKYNSYNKNVKITLPKV